MDWLDRMVICSSCIIEVYILYDYYKSFFDIREIWNKKEILAICSIACVILFGVNLMENGYVNLLTTLIVLGIMIMVLFEGSLMARIGYYILAYIVMIGVEGLYGIISNIAVSELKLGAVTEVSENVWQFLFIKFLNYIIFLVIKQSVSAAAAGREKRYVANKYCLMYLCLPVATLGCMITVFYSGIDFSKNMTQRILMTVFFVLMIFGNMLVFYAFQKYTENVQTAIMQQNMLECYEKELNNLSRISDINAGNREFMHDIRHYVKVIGNMAQEGKNENICKIVTEIGSKFEEKAVRVYSPNVILNTLLSIYHTDADRIGIKYNVYVEPGITLEHIKDVDLIAVFSNLLENALIAAEKKSCNAEIEIKVFKNAGNYIIKIKNDFAEKLNIHKERLISIKTDGGIHGIGMNSVKHIVEGYGGCMEYHTEGNKFVVVAVLPNSVRMKLPKTDIKLPKTDIGLKEMKFDVQWEYNQGKESELP